MSGGELDNIGGKIRSLRQSKQMTVRELAKLADVTPGLISQIEHGRVSPSLSTLKRILAALGETIISLVEQDIGEQALKGVVRKEERRRVFVSPGLTYELISSKNRAYSMFISYLEPGYDSGENFYSHEGIESGLVIQGSVEISLGDKSVVLNEGDSITYPSTIPHKWKNVGKVPAVGVWVVSPPSF
ncbi:MAG: helix-turn-helix domain-containing protein [Pseudothermotoga sp.]